MTQNKQKAKKLARLNRVLKLLTYDAMNRLQLKDAMYCSGNTVDEYIKELKADNKIYIAYYVRTNGMPSPHYLAGNSFDAVKPKAFNQAERELQFKKRKDGIGIEYEAEDVKLVEPKFKPRRDIAASWF